MWGVSLKHPVLASFLSGEFLLNIPCWLHFYVGSFSYTTRADFGFMRGVCLTHPVLYWFLCKEFLLHISCSLLSFFYSFFLSREFLLHIPCWFLLVFRGRFSHISHAGFIFIWGVSLTHPVLASLLSVEFLLHIPCCIYSSVWSFSYISQAGFFRFFRKTFNLVSFSYVSRWLHFYLGSFSYTSRDGLTFIRRVPLTQPMLALVFCGRFLLHIPYWLFFFFFFFKTF